MSWMDDKYFGYIASSYTISIVVFVIFLVWILAQHRGFKRQLMKLEERGITRRSAKSLRGPRT